MMEALESEGPPTYTLEWYEYIVFGIVLIASLGIGFLFRSKDTTNDDFLMGGRSMSILPVTLSLICSFVSAITLLGNPVEVYFYGAQFGLVALAFIPMTIALAYIYVPVYFDLQLVSAYQYFEWRFSSSVRYILSLFSLAQLLTYMPTAVWGPSLALKQAAALNPYLSAGIIFVVCIASSSSGGLKGILWGNALQAIIMLGSMLAVVGLGVYEVGGFETIWETARATNRHQLLNFDTDTRYRHTFWTTMIGGTIFWLCLFAATQAQIQRYNSVPTLRHSRMCLLYNMFGLILTLILCALVGLVIYTHYATCDPVESKRVTSPDQLLPIFTMDVLSKYPGVSGLLVAGLTCGSLSTVSSVVNSLAAIIVEDFVKFVKPGLSEIQLGVASKIASVVTGTVSFTLIFLIAFLNDVIQIQPFATVWIATLYGPILGAFTLGMLFPWANNIGALSGILVSIFFTGFLGISQVIVGKMDQEDIFILNQKLFLTTEGCNNSSLHISEILARSDYWNQTPWQDRESSFINDVFNTSYMWQPTVGFLTTLIVGIIVSAIVIIFQKEPSEKVHKSLMSEPFLKLWKKCFGENHMNKWVDYGAPNFRKLIEAKK